MTRPTAVYASAQVRSEAATDAVLASLPLSYAPGRSDGHALTIVTGSIGWPATVAEAFDAGAMAVIVVWPQPADLGALRGRRGIVVLDSRWAPNPVMRSAAPAFAAALPEAGRIECQAYLPVGAALEPALLDQLTLVRALIGAVTDVRILTRSSHGFAAEGLAAGHPVDFELVCTGAVPESARVRLLTQDGSVDLVVPHSGIAQPARLMITSPDGALQSPTLYESGHRASWRRVPDLLANPSAARDLEDFASDQETTRTAFQHVGG